MPEGPPGPPTVLRFDCFEADLDAGVLLRHGARIRLREQSFRVLSALLQRPGQLVTRGQLRQQLWPDRVFVDFENSLNTAVGRLREALGDSAERPRFIETLPKRGYRFIASVWAAPPSPAPSTTPGLRLLVLPFVNATGDRAHEHEADAMTDGLITELACTASAASTPPSLHVVAHATAMHYKGTHKDVAHIGRELAIDYLVEGSLAVEDDRLRLTVQLTRVSDQTDVWARRWDVGRREIAAVQADIAREVIARLDAQT